LLRNHDREIQRERTEFPSIFQTIALMHHPTYRLLLSCCLILMFHVWGSGHLHAQCQRVGWVASVTPGCGVKIIDLDNGQILRAFDGAETLTGGQTIRFSSAPAELPMGCFSEGYQVVSLTCVSDTLPCAAQFGYFVANESAFLINFEANVYDPSVQTCSWNFGDGQTGSGNNIQHLYSAPGVYSVCMTVSDPFGCSAQICKEVSVSTQNPNDCGYETEVTAVGLHLYGKLSPITFNPDQYVSSVEWYTSKSNQVLSNNPVLSAQLPGYGDYLICAQYKIKNSVTGDSCTTTRCQPLVVVEAGCKNPVMDQVATICPPVYAPVCGCDGLTYGNECEAQGAGLSVWWAGTCAEAMGSCHLEMEAKVIGGSPEEGFIVQFVRTSGNDFAFVQLDYGDGTALWEGTQFDTLTHTYPAGGIYKTNLSGWINNACVSSVTQLVFTDAYNMSVDNMPGGTDYVMPGDANGDFKANVYDLLNIGIGHYAAGAPRPFATSDWTPQFAPDWPQAVTQTVNYKHLDCDGNGAVNALDADVILEHYAPIDTTEVFPMADAPPIWVSFPMDTIILDTDNPQQLEITADLNLGTPAHPALNIYGLACALRYPEFVDHNLSANYDGACMFGFNHMLWLPKDNHSRRQLDIGLTRTNGQAVSGYGRIAQLTFRSDFIIIIDVGDRTDQNVIPFRVPINGLIAVDEYGNEKQLTVLQDTLWIKLTGTSATHTPNWENAVTVYPNPTENYTMVRCQDQEMSRIEVVNVLGQVCQTLSCNGSTARVDLKDYPQGIYTFRIYAEKGMVEKRVVKE